MQLPLPAMVIALTISLVVFWMRKAASTNRARSGVEIMLSNIDEIIIHLFV